MGRIEIFDSMLRDGAQGEGVAFSVLDKLNIVKALDAFGVDYADMIVRETKFYAAACGTPGVEYVEAYTLCTDWPVICGAHKLLP